MMQKMFKTPADISSCKPKDLIVALRKVFDKGVKGTEFIFKGEFNYQIDPATKKPEVAPMIFIGPPSGKWNEFIKAHKTDPDFAEGYCKLDATNPTDLVLQIQVVAGKGAKDAFLKELDKQILKKINAKVLVVPKIEVDGDDAVDDIHIDSHAGESEPDASDNETNQADDDATKPKTVTPKELAFAFNSIFQNYKTVRDSEHDIEEVRALHGDMEEWLKDYNTLSDAGKAALKTQYENYQKILDGVNKVLKADEHIDDRVADLIKTVQAYAALPDHSAPQAKTLHQQADKLVGELENFARFVGSGEILAQCQAIKALLAD